MQENSFHQPPRKHDDQLSIYNIQFKLMIVASALYSSSTLPLARAEGSDKLSPSQSPIYSIVKQ